MQCRRNRRMNEWILDGRLIVNTIGWKVTTIFNVGFCIKNCRKICSEQSEESTMKWQYSLYSKTAKISKFQLIVQSTKLWTFAQCLSKDPLIWKTADQWNLLNKTISDNTWMKDETTFPENRRSRNCKRKIIANIIQTVFRRCRERFGK